MTAATKPQGPRAADRVLDLLRTGAQGRVKEIAKPLGMSGQAVYLALLQLRARGLVVRHDVRAANGSPAFSWRLIASGEAPQIDEPLAGLPYPSTVQRAIMARPPLHLWASGELRA
jgi:predicted ArsR family transcriptional regulator